MCVATGNMLMTSSAALWSAESFAVIMERSEWPLQA